jgi:hypothetical protein
MNPPVNTDELEQKLGAALALIHRVLPRLDEPARAAEVQSCLGRAAALLEAVRAAHGAPGGPKAVAPAGPQPVATNVEPEIAAAIAAAISVLFAQPYRLVSVQKVVIPVPHVNVWAYEGRSEIFHSHRIR